MNDDLKAMLVIISVFTCFAIIGFQCQAQRDEKLIKEFMEDQDY